MEGNPSWQLPFMALAIVSCTGFTLWSVGVSAPRSPFPTALYPWPTAIAFAVAALIGAVLILMEESGTLTVVVWLGSLFLTITAVSGGAVLWLAFAAQTLAFLATAAVMWLYFD